MAVRCCSSPARRADDGCTSVAANLAAALAEPGAKVLLVDADLRRPSIGEVFNAGRRPGWSDLLARRASLDEVAVPVARRTRAKARDRGRSCRQASGDLP